MLRPEVSFFTLPELKRLRAQDTFSIPAGRREVAFNFPLQRRYEGAMLPKLTISARTLKIAHAHADCLCEPRRRTRVIALDGARTRRGMRLMHFVFRHVIL